MRKIRNRIKLMVACTAASIACIGVGTVSLNRATALAEETSPTFWVPGASVKYVHDVEQQETQDGLRFAIAVENDVFDSWLNAEQTAFAEGISVGALVAPKDLVGDDALTLNTQLSQGYVISEEFSFEDFSDATLAEYAGCKMAYVYLYDIPAGAYNREYMVAAYCDNNGEVTYTNTLARSIAWVALQAKENGDPNAEMLAGYLKKYAVNVYVDGEELTGSQMEVVYGDKIDTSKLPVKEGGKITWYADETFETEFDFEQAVTGTTNVYGKYQTSVELSGGVFSRIDNDYVVGDGDNLTLTQTLQNSSARKGYAELNVEAGSDFYVSADLSLTKWIKVASQGWDAGENDRLGFALVNANGENYRMQLRSVMAAVLTYEKSKTLYGGNPATSKFLLGSTNDTSKEVYASGHIQLKNTTNMNSVGTVKLAMSKVGNNLFFYVNGELVAVQEIEADFNGVPALFAYSFASPSAQVITYSNITIGEGVAPSFGVNFKVAGENVASTTVVYGNVIGESALPTTSAGVYTWYVDEAMETKFDFAQAITADTVIYGKLTLNEYDVVVYIDGEVNTTLKVAHGNAIDQTQLPTVEKGKLTWYADETFGTAFDFAQIINGAVSVYGKYQSVYDLTGGTFTDADSDYAISGEGESLKLTQALGHGTEGGLAYFNVKDSDVYSISVDIKLSGRPATAAQDKNGAADARVGFVLINPETQQNYRFLFRPTQTALIFYDISSDLYELRSGSAFEESKGAVTYVYGKTNSTPKEPKLVLQNTSAINDYDYINLAMTKVGDTVSVYLNGELWTTKTVEDGFVGVPALLSYSLDGKTRSHTYSNVAITTCTTKCAVCGLCDDEKCALHTTKCVETLGYFGVHTSDYKAVKDSNGKWTVSQTLGNGKDDKGLAYFDVTDNNNYQISVDIKLSNNPATAYQGVNDGVDARVGFVLIDPETKQNYRFLFRPTQSALIFYDISSELYEVRSGSAFEETKTGEVTYVYGKGNTVDETPKLVLQNTSAINNNPNIKLTIAKLGDTVSVYLNGELWTTVTVEAGFAGVPALFSYCLDGKTRVHAYSNVAIKTCVETCETCGLCPDANCLIHNSTKCVSAIGFGEHTSDYKAVKDSSGNWTVSQALGNGKDGKGLAYFGAIEGDYSISVDIKLSGNPATAKQGVNDGADARVGFVLIDPETNENYRFLFRPTQTALIYYDKSTTLYEVRSGSAFEESKGAVTYVYGKGNTVDEEPKLVLQNTQSINGSVNIKLKMVKVGDTVSVYLNGELWTTKTVEAGFAGVPALLSYSLDGKTRSHTYSNIVIEAVANA